MTARILVVEDDHDLRDLLVEVLQAAGYTPVPYATGEAARSAIEEGVAADLLLTDLVLPGVSGQHLLQASLASRPGLPVLVMTAFGSIKNAIELVKDGAFDYLTKPLVTEGLLLSVGRALAERHAPALIPTAMGAVPPPVGFVGNSDRMQQLYRLIARAGGSHHPVLITGESGTGKELVARALHQVSARHAFVAVNCGALPEQLFESELFGHERGAFTGAERAKEGLFETADGGTLFLDEVAELPLPLQPKLLRALEVSEIRRVGATHSRTVDIRLIVATNRDLEQEVESGRFRSDLYWRLAVLHLHVAPLRERPEDILPLANHFLQAGAGTAVSNAPGLMPDAAGALASYPWPGNVRELRNAMHRAATLRAHDAITLEDLPPRILTGGPATRTLREGVHGQLPLREVERLYILEVLRGTGGNKTRAAEILGLDRKTLHRKVEEYQAEDHPIESGEA